MSILKSKSAQVCSLFFPEYLETDPGAVSDYDGEASPNRHAHANNPADGSNHSHDQDRRRGSRDQKRPRSEDSRGGGNEIMGILDRRHLRANHKTNLERDTGAKDAPRASAGASIPLIVEQVPGQQYLWPAASETEDASKKYARRSRHKIKADKYEYKGHLDHGRKQDVREPKRKYKRHRRKKTGEVLIHEFKAPNVGTERLTLKPNTGPGIFNKGKASSPAIRRGLPDLTFSEMTFLAKRREVAVAKFPNARETKPTHNVRQGSAHEISEFFSRAADNGGGLRPSIEATTQHKSCSGLPKSHSASSPAKLGGRNPLRAVSGDISNKRTMSIPSTNQSLSREVRRECQPSHQNWLRKVQKPVSFAKTASVERSASHVSWSATPSRRSHHNNPGNAEIVLKSMTSAQEIPPLRQRNPPTQDTAFLYPTNSSLSDKSLEHYARHTLTGENSRLWQGISKTVDGTRNYSLEDLHGLAQLMDYDLDNDSTRTRIEAEGQLEQVDEAFIPRDLPAHDRAANNYTSLIQDPSASHPPSVASRPIIFKRPAILPSNTTSHPILPHVRVYDSKHHAGLEINTTRHAQVLNDTMLTSQKEMQDPDYGATAIYYHERCGSNLYEQDRMLNGDVKFESGYAQKSDHYTGVDIRQPRSETQYRRSHDQGEVERVHTREHAVSQSRKLPYKDLDLFDVGLLGADSARHNPSAYEDDLGVHDLAEQAFYQLGEDNNLCEGGLDGENMGMTPDASGLVYDQQANPATGELDGLNKETDRFAGRWVSRGREEDVDRNEEEAFMGFRRPHMLY